MWCDVSQISDEWPLATGQVQDPSPFWSQADSTCSSLRGSDNPHQFLVRLQPLHELLHVFWMLKKSFVIFRAVVSSLWIRQQRITMPTFIDVFHCCCCSSVARLLLAKLSLRDDTGRFLTCSGLPQWALEKQAPVVSAYRCWQFAGDVNLSRKVLCNVLKQGG